MDNDARHDIIKKHVARMREHFDSVQVFAARATEDGTACFQWGSGSWYERYGVVRCWLLKQDEGERIDARKDKAEE